MFNLNLPIDLKWLGHAGFLIRHNGANIYIDPFKISDHQPKADIVFITHEHYDHFSIDDLNKIIKKETKIIAPKKVTESLTDFENEFLVVRPFEEYYVAGLKFKTLPSYNLNKEFHPKEKKWVGYLIYIDNFVVYHTGDSDFIPEMRNLKVDMLLVPVSGTYTMDAKEAANLAKTIKPGISIPMHYGKIVGSLKDAIKFKDLLKKEGVEVIILEENQPVS